jgi:hypothetical protein
MTVPTAITVYRRGRGSSIQGKTFGDNVGKLPWAAGLVQPAKTLRTRLNAEGEESPTGVAHEPVGAMKEG